MIDNIYCTVAHVSIMSLHKMHQKCVRGQLVLLRRQSLSLSFLVVQYTDICKLLDTGKLGNGLWPLVNN